ncbi:MAG: hypothetical protein BroJett025_08790 [Patescibacteria group bacterium]|nr:MAG: hypothetical protein BroJett025_08790 [Patescibacteria group bacterium]
MALIRKQEAEAAMQFLGASLTILRFPDLGLPFVPLQELVAAVLPIVREVGADALFSFHPKEITNYFDHPDHNRAGEVAKYVRAAADVAHYMPKSAALKKRPELYLWTTKKQKMKIHLSEQTRAHRNDYLTKCYPSQFSTETKEVWGAIFDDITNEKHKTNEGKLHTERYKRVKSNK